VNEAKSILLAVEMSLIEILFSQLFIVMFVDNSLLVAVIVLTVVAVLLLIAAVILLILYIKLRAAYKRL